VLAGAVLAGAVRAGAVLAGAAARPEDGWPPEGAVLWATGTARGAPLPSAFPPSIGTTGPVLRVGAGLDRGTGADRPLSLAGFPPTVASTTPVVAPVRASTLITTGTSRRRRAAGSATAPNRRRQQRRTASASESIVPNISPRYKVPAVAGRRKYPGKDQPGARRAGPRMPVRHQCRRGTPAAGCVAHRVRKTVPGGTPSPEKRQAGWVRAAWSCSGVVTGAWQVNWRQT